LFLERNLRERKKEPREREVSREKENYELREEETVSCGKEGIQPREREERHNLYHPRRGEFISQLLRGIKQGRQ
jgi:hypothetical protein